MRVEDADARDFYEREAIDGGWGKRTLERQIQSYNYERTMKSSELEKLLAEGRKLTNTPQSPKDSLKAPMYGYRGCERWK